MNNFYCIASDPPAPNMSVPRSPDARTNDPPANDYHDTEIDIDEEDIDNSAMVIFEESFDADEGEKDLDVNVPLYEESSTAEFFHSPRSRAEAIAKTEAYDRKDLHATHSKSTAAIRDIKGAMIAKQNIDRHLKRDGLVSLKRLIATTHTDTKKPLLANMKALKKEKKVVLSMARDMATNAVNDMATNAVKAWNSGKTPNLTDGDVH